MGSNDTEDFLNEALPIFLEALVIAVLLIVFVERLKHRALIGFSYYCKLFFNYLFIIIERGGL